MTRPRAADDPIVGLYYGCRNPRTVGCAIAWGQSQETCKRCNDPPIGCIGCVKALGLPIAECLACLTETGSHSRACPPRVDKPT